MTTSARQLFDKEAARTWHLISNLSSEDLHRPIRDDGWSAFQIAAHLATSTRGLTQIARAGLKQRDSGQQGASSVGENFDLHRWNEEQAAAWKGRSLAELEAEWQSVSSYFHHIVGQISEDDLDLELPTPMGRPMVLSNLLSMITMHLRIHRQEIEQGLATGMATSIDH